MGSVQVTGSTEAEDSMTPLSNTLNVADLVGAASSNAAYTVTGAGPDPSSDGWEDCVFKQLKLTVTFSDAANAGKQNPLKCTLPDKTSACGSGMQPRMPLSKQQVAAETNTDMPKPTCTIIDDAYGTNGDLLDG